MTSFHLKLSKTLKKAVTSCALAATVSLPLASNSVAAEHNWRFANLYPRGTGHAGLYENFAKDIETMSGGRISVKMTYAGEGIGTAGILGSVKSGLMTMERLSRLCTLANFLLVLLKWVCRHNVGCWRAECSFP